MNSAMEMLTKVLGLVSSEVHYWDNHWYNALPTFICFWRIGGGDGETLIKWSRSLSFVFAVGRAIQFWLRVVAELYNKKLKKDKMKEIKKREIKAVGESLLWWF